MKFSKFSVLSKLILKAVKEKYSASKNEQVEIFRIFDTYDMVAYVQLINFHMHTLFAGTKSKMTFASNSTHVKSCTCVVVFIFTKTSDSTST